MSNYRKGPQYPAREGAKIPGNPTNRVPELGSISGHATDSNFYANVPNNAMPFGSDFNNQMMMMQHANYGPQYPANFGGSKMPGDPANRVPELGSIGGHATNSANVLFNAYNPRLTSTLLTNLGGQPFQEQFGSNSNSFTNINTQRFSGNMHGMAEIGGMGVGAWRDDSPPLEAPPPPRFTFDVSDTSQGVCMSGPIKTLDLTEEDAPLPPPRLDFGRTSRSRRDQNSASQKLSFDLSEMRRMTPSPPTFTFASSGGFIQEAPPPPSLSSDLGRRRNDQFHLKSGSSWRVGQSSPPKISPPKPVRFSLLPRGAEEQNRRSPPRLRFDITELRQDVPVPPQLNFGGPSGVQLPQDEPTVFSRRVGRNSPPRSNFGRNPVTMSYQRDEWDFDLGDHDSPALITENPIVWRNPSPTFGGQPIVAPSAPVVGSANPSLSELLEQTLNAIKEKAIRLNLLPNESRETSRPAQSISPPRHQVAYPVLPSHQGRGMGFDFGDEPIYPTNVILQRERSFSRERRRESVTRGSRERSPRRDRRRSRSPYQRRESPHYRRGDSRERRRSRSPHLRGRRGGYVSPPPRTVRERRRTSRSPYSRERRYGSPHRRRRHSQSRSSSRQVSPLRTSPIRRIRESSAERRAESRRRLMERKRLEELNDEKYLGKRKRSSQARSTENLPEAKKARLTSAEKRRAYYQERLETLASKREKLLAVIAEKEKAAKLSDNGKKSELETIDEEGSSLPTEAVTEVVWNKVEGYKDQPSVTFPPPIAAPISKKNRLPTIQIPISKEKNPIKVLELHIAFWNLEILQERSAQSMTVFFNEIRPDFDIFNLDMLGLNQVMCPGQTGEYRSSDRDYVFLYSNDSSETERKPGVGLLITNRMRTCLQNWRAVSNNIITARIRQRKCYLTVIHCHGPRTDEDEESKAKFYALLDETKNKAPKDDIIVIMGDLDASVSSTALERIPEVVGLHGVQDESNDNGKKLIEFCAKSQLFIAGTFFGVNRDYVLTHGQNRATGQQLSHFVMNYFYKPYLVMLSNRRVTRIHTVYKENVHNLMVAHLRLGPPNLRPELRKQRVNIEVAKRYKFALSSGDADDKRVTSAENRSIPKKTIEDEKSKITRQSIIQKYPNPFLVPSTDIPVERNSSVEAPIQNPTAASGTVSATRYQECAYIKSQTSHGFVTLKTPVLKVSEINTQEHGPGWDGVMVRIYDPTTPNHGIRNVSKKTKQQFRQAMITIYDDYMKTVDLNAIPKFLHANFFRNAYKVVCMNTSALAFIKHAIAKLNKSPPYENGRFTFKLQATNYLHKASMFISEEYKDLNTTNKSWLIEQIAKYNPKLSVKDWLITKITVKKKGIPEERRTVQIAVDQKTRLQFGPMIPIEILGNKLVLVTTQMICLPQDGGLTWDQMIDEKKSMANNKRRIVQLKSETLAVEVKNEMSTPIRQNKDPKVEQKSSSSEDKLIGQAAALALKIETQWQKLVKSEVLTESKTVEVDQKGKTEAVDSEMKVVDGNIQESIEEKPEKCSHEAEKPTIPKGEAQTVDVEEAMDTRDESDQHNTAFVEEEEVKSTTEAAEQTTTDENTVQISNLQEAREQFQDEKSTSTADVNESHEQTAVVQKPTENVPSLDSPSPTVQIFNLKEAPEQFEDAKSTSTADVNESNEQTSVAQNPTENVPSPEGSQKPNDEPNPAVPVASTANSVENNLGDSATNCEKSIEGFLDELSDYLDENDLQLEDNLLDRVNVDLEATPQTESDQPDDKDVTEKADIKKMDELISAKNDSKPPGPVSVEKVTTPGSAAGSTDLPVAVQMDPSPISNRTRNSRARQAK